MKDSRKLLRTAIRLIPEIPYVNKKQSNVLPFVLGGAAVVLAGGIAALFIFSPRTRTRALGAAKDAYGTVQEKIGETPLGQRVGLGPKDKQNGLSDQKNGYSTGV